MAQATLGNQQSILRNQKQILQKRSARALRWAAVASGAPAEYIAAQMKAIVGVHLEIDRLEGKWKMSQNRSAADVQSIIQGLSASTRQQDAEVAHIVIERQRFFPTRQ